MKKTSLLLIIATLLSFTFEASAKKKNKQDLATTQWEYEIEPAIGQARQGSCIVKVWSYAKNVELATKQAAKNAVHGILFKGYGASTDGSRIPAQHPLVPDLQTELENKAYFDEFFKDGGPYMRYVSLINNGIPNPNDLIKISKKLYKVGIVVTVRKDDLRKELENAGIIKALNAGF